MKTNPKDTYTIQEFITSGNNIVTSYHKLSYLEKLNNNTLAPIHNVINDYITELVKISRYITMNETEYQKYIYKPKLLCEDLYGNGELYFIPLLINNICDVKFFDKKVLMLPTKRVLSEFITSLLNNEKKLIDDYNQK